MEASHILNESLTQLFTVQKIELFIRAAILLFIGLPLVIMASKWIRKYTSTKYTAQKGMIYSKVILYSGITIIVVSVLHEMGFKLTALLGAAGIVGIALGFASQTSVSNIISGLFLIAEKPFEVDDIITVGSNTGVVLSIDMLSIKLRTFDNKFLRIPNETIIKSEVTNVTRFPIRRIDINVGIAYKEDIAKVREILLDIAHNNPLCLNEPTPLVIFSGFGTSSIDLLFLVWAVKTDWLTLKNSITEEIKNRFDEEGIEIPFPHLSLYNGSASGPIPIKIIRDTGKEPAEG